MTKTIKGFTKAQLLQVITSLNEEIGNIKEQLGKQAKQQETIDNFCWFFPSKNNPDNFVGVKFKDGKSEKMTDPEDSSYDLLARIVETKKGKAIAVNRVYNIK